MQRHLGPAPSRPDDLVRFGDLPSSTGGSAAARALVNATTAVLASGAVDATKTIVLGKAYVLYSIQTSRPARVTLYTSGAARTADATRGAGYDPSSDAGVVLDYITPDTATHSLSPVVHGANLEAQPIDTISMRVTNLDTAPGTVVVTLNGVKAE